MKVSVVPAQITTVEDRIAGNLNLTQLLLLSVPLFITVVMFFILPPFEHYSILKLVISLIAALISSVLSIRIKDKLVLDLIKLRANYELRPHIYVYRKQSQHEIYENEKLEQPLQNVFTSNYKITNLSKSANSSSARLLKDRNYKVSFQTKSGGLIVKVSTN